MTRSNSPEWKKSETDALSPTIRKLDFGECSQGGFVTPPLHARSRLLISALHGLIQPDLLIDLVSLHVGGGNSSGRDNGPDEVSCSGFFAHGCATCKVPLFRAWFYICTYVMSQSSHNALHLRGQKEISQRRARSGQTRWGKKALVGFRGTTLGNFLQRACTPTYT